ncbi:MAG: HNH endonuclease signature motif containing protein [Acidobacteriota bacterium]
MPISNELRWQIRVRANFACEYCGVTETSAGAELTLDHFRPKSKGGGDSPDNLVYCCPQCNWYKGDYWPKLPTATHLWNPRLEPFSRHFRLEEDGVIVPLTEVGELTTSRLQLNRVPLVAHRRQQLPDDVREKTALTPVRQYGFMRSLAADLKSQLEALRDRQRVVIVLRELAGRRFQTEKENDEIDS